jgi:hypothetical protein
MYLDNYHYYLMARVQHLKSTNRTGKERVLTYRLHHLILMTVQMPALLAVLRTLPSSPSILKGLDG